MKNSSNTDVEIIAIFYNYNDFMIVSDLMSKIYLKTNEIIGGVYKKFGNRRLNMQKM